MLFFSPFLSLDMGSNRAKIIATITKKDSHQVNGITQSGLHSQLHAHIHIFAMTFLRLEMTSWGLAVGK